MKKCVVGVILVVVLVSYSYAGTLSWQNLVTQFYTDGGGTPPNNTWYYALYSTGVDGLINAWTGSSAGDDVLLEGKTTGMTGGMFSDSYSFTGTYEVYVRLFNNADPNSAAKFVDGITGAASFTLDDTGTGDYDAGGSASNGSDWVVVPEPSSFALMGLGLLVIGAHRKFAKR